MDEGPKIPKDAVLDPGERLDLLLGHLGACRAELSEKEPAATSRRVRARCIAAMIDGARAWQRFRFVVVPSIAGIIRLNLILTTIFTFNYFDLI